MIDALNVGDWTSIHPHLAPDVVLDNTRVRGENQGIFHGRDEVQRQWERWIEVWAAVRIDLLDTTTIGDQVVVPHSANFRGRQGIEVTARPTWLLTFRSDQVTRICFYQEEQEALEAARAAPALTDL